MSKSHLVAGGGVLLLFVSGVSLLKTCTGHRATSAFREYADRAAEPAVGVGAKLSGFGTVVVLVFEAEMDSEFRAVVDGMLQGLHQGGARVAHVERIAPRAGGGWRNVGGIPYAEFLRVAELHPDAGAIVSLCGPLYGPIQDNPPDPRSLPALVLARSLPDNPELAQWLHQGRVAMAVTFPGFGRADAMLSPGPTIRISPAWADILP